VYLSHQDVVQERIQEEPKLVHRLISHFLSRKTLMQDTLRLSVFNAKMHLEAPFKKMVGKLNRQEIVEQLWLEQTNLLHTVMLKLSIKLSHLYTLLPPLVLISSPTLMLPCAETSIIVPSNKQVVPTLIPQVI